MMRRRQVQFLPAPTILKRVSMNAILVQPIILGMNLITLAGFGVMMLGTRLARHRTFSRSFGARTQVNTRRFILSVTLMIAGSVVVFVSQCLLPS